MRFLVLMTFRHSLTRIRFCEFMWIFNSVVEYVCLNFRKHGSGDWLPGCDGFHVNGNVYI